MIKSFFTFSFFTLISRVLGFVRDIFIASALGTGWVAEAFFVAFRIPNFFRRLFAEGAFNSAFIPILNKLDEKEAKEFAANIFTRLLVYLLGFLVLVELLMPIMVYAFAGGYANEEEKFSYVIKLSRICFPYLFFISLASLIGAVLNSKDRYLPTASAPIILNLCLISGAYLTKGENAEYLAYAVFLAGLLQLIWLIMFAKANDCMPSLRGTKQRSNQSRDDRLVDGSPRSQKLPRDDDSRVKEFAKKFMPAVFGAGIVQINLLIDTFIATFFTGAVAYLYYAERLVQLPLALIATALGIVILPSLSKNPKNEELQAKAIHFVLYLILPAALGLAFFAETIISVLFERGKFVEDDSYMSALALAVYAIALPAFGLNKVLSTFFFSNSDTRTPVKASIYAIAANLVANLILLFSFIQAGMPPHLAIAGGTAVSAWVNVLLLTKYAKRNSYFDISILNKSLIFNIIISLMLMLTLMLAWDSLDIQNQIINLAGAIGCAVIVYFVSSIKVFRKLIT